MCLSSISNSDNGPGPFGLSARLLAFLSPCILVVGLWYVVALRTGECWSAASVADSMMKHENALAGNLYFPENYELVKLRMIQEKEPEMWVLGSSRALQFRSFMFKPLESKFFNAGMPKIDSLASIEFIVRLLADETVPRPRAVLLSTDHMWFRRQEGKERNQMERAYRGGPAAASHLYALRKWLRYPMVPMTLWDFGEPLGAKYYGYRAIGVYPIVADAGMRVDGSFLYGTDVQDYLHTREFRDTVLLAERIRDGQLTASGFDPGSVDRFLTSLATLREMDIEVVTYFAPLSTESYAEITKVTALAELWSACRNIVAARVRSEGYPCVYLETPSNLGLTDEYMLDGGHPSEVMNTYFLRWLVDTLPPGSVFRQLDTRNMETLLSRNETLPVSFFLEGHPDAIEALLAGSP